MIYNDPKFASGSHRRRFLCTGLCARPHALPPCVHAFSSHTIETCKYDLCLSYDNLQAVVKLVHLSEYFLSFALPGQIVFRYQCADNQGLWTYCNLHTLVRRLITRNIDHNSLARFKTCRHKSSYTHSVSVKGAAIKCGLLSLPELLCNILGNTPQAKRTFPSP